MFYSNPGGQAESSPLVRALKAAVNLARGPQSRQRFELRPVGNGAPPCLLDDDRCGLAPFLLLHFGRVFGTGRLHVDG